MKKVIVKYLYRGQEKEKEITVADWHQLLASDKYQHTVGRLRANIALEGPHCVGTPEGLTDLPDVHVSTSGTYHGLLVLTLLVSEGTSWSRLRHVVGMLPQTLLAFRGSSGRTLKVVCMATLPEGLLPEGDHDIRLFRQHAMALAAHYYEGQTGLKVVAGDGGRRCRMSSDRDAIYHERAIAFVLEQPTEPLAISLRRRTAALPLVATDRLPGYDDSMMQMTRFQFCYAEVMAQQHEELDIMLEELARTCMQNALEAEFCLRRLMHMRLYQDYEVLIRRTFRNIYGICYQRPALLSRKTDSLPYFTLHMELLKQFMQSRYQLRRNIISDGIEYVACGNLVADWQLLDRHALATITMEALSEGIEAWDKDIQRYIDSTWVSDYDPVTEYLNSLPRWDGQDRVVQLARRVPVKNDHWPHDLHVWLRAMVAQWLGVNGEHGNALVPLLIGAQGDGKSTFCRMLLPEELQDYYTDRVDFTNRNAAERMLTRFCLINLDEYDSLSTRQNAFLKHVLQKADVKTRKLYDSLVLNRQRYATFIGTTNDPTPLTDMTGSRRFLCVRTTGRIDTQTPVDHRQLYAQLLAEVREGLPTFFDQNEEARIQRQNVEFQQFDALAETFFEHYHKPVVGEKVVKRSAIQLLTDIKRHTVGIRLDDASVKRLSRLLLNRGFHHQHTRTQNVFSVAENKKVKDG